MTVPAGFVKQAEIATAVSSVEERLRPDVIRVRHSIGSDWSGDPALFLRVVLSDPASDERRLGEVANRIMNTLTQELDPFERWGLLPYFSFRSQSEQADLKEEAWA